MTNWSSIGLSSINKIRDLAGRYRLIAPDYPGFGQFSLYVQDYGGPVGFRIAVRRPEWVQSLIIQNANAYEEGLGEAVEPLVGYIREANEKTEKAEAARLIDRFLSGRG